MKVKDLIAQLRGCEESEVKCMVIRTTKNNVIEVLAVMPIVVLDNSRNGDDVILGVQMDKEK